MSNFFSLILTNYRRARNKLIYSDSETTNIETKDLVPENKQPEMRQLRLTIYSSRNIPQWSRRWIVRFHAEALTATRLFCDHSQTVGEVRQCHDQSDNHDDQGYQNRVQE